MIGKKTGKSCFKKFVLVPNKAQFQNITSTHSFHIEERKEKSQQQIIVPPFHQVEPICPSKNKAIPPHYIKVIEGKIVKDKFHYQLDSIDLNFYKNNFPYLSEELFAKIIVKLQKMSYKSENQINYQKIMERCLKGTDLDLTQQEKQHMMKSMFNFWRNKRKNLKSPLVRQFWIKTQFGPFKNRQNCSDALCLRNRTVKVEDWYIREVLKSDLLLLKSIFQLMKVRQKTQQKLIKYETESFQRSCRKVIKMIQEEEQYQNEDEQTISLKNRKELGKKKGKKKQKSRDSNQKQRKKMKCRSRVSVENEENSPQDT